jgi:nicotinate-nucleotide adenylyltransferase
MTNSKAGFTRVALYGGAFDPVHDAHLRVASYALKQVGLERVLFIPSAQSPLKQNPPRASDEERVEMLELATDGERRYRVETYEVEKGGISYTFETVLHFSQEYPNAELFWMVGADQFEQLDRWRNIEALAGRVTFLVFGRPGYSHQACDIPGLKYFTVDAPQMDESSTDIRRLRRAGESVTGMLPVAVEAFISEEGLYTGVE